MYNISQDLQIQQCSQDLYKHNTNDNNLNRPILKRALSLDNNINISNTSIKFENNQPALLKRNKIKLNLDIEESIKSANMLYNQTLTNSLNTVDYFISTLLNALDCFHNLIEHYNNIIEYYTKHHIVDNHNSQANINQTINTDMLHKRYKSCSSAIYNSDFNHLSYIITDENIKRTEPVSFSCSNRDYMDNKLKINKTYNTPSLCNETTLSPKNTLKVKMEYNRSQRHKFLLKQYSDNIMLNSVYTLYPIIPVTLDDAESLKKKMEFNKQERERLFPLMNKKMYDVQDFNIYEEYNQIKKKPKHVVICDEPIIICDESQTISTSDIQSQSNTVLTQSPKAKEHLKIHNESNVLFNLGSIESNLDIQSKSDTIISYNITSDTLTSTTIISDITNITNNTIISDNTSNNIISDTTSDTIISNATSNTIISDTITSDTITSDTITKLKNNKKQKKNKLRNNPILKTLSRLITCSHKRKSK